MKNILFSILLAVVLSTSCTTGKPDNFDYGKIENGKYVNSFFGCEITIPESWSVQSNEQINNLVEQGRELIAGDDKNMKAMYKASEINTANLLMAFEYEVGATVEFNTNIAIVAENLANTPGIKKGSDYLFHVKKLLSQTQVDYSHIDEQCEREEIAGAVFYKMNTTLNFAGVDIYQTYYSTILNNFSFSIVISYSGDEQHQQLLQILKSLKFTN